MKQIQTQNKQLEADPNAEADLQETERGVNMDYMALIEEFIKPELLILIPVLYCIGWAMKNSKKFKDELIPSVLGFVGIIITTVYLLATTTVSTTQEVMLVTFTAITQGILVAACAVYVNQIFIQRNRARENTTAGEDEEGTNEDILEQLLKKK